jgi:chorismate synthase
MAGNRFGKIFSITTFGESHGRAIGVTIDGCPAGLQIDEAVIQADLDRRRPGQSEITTPRNEADRCQILSGVFDGKTTGTPIMILIFNKDQLSKDYSLIKDSFRPSHADYSYTSKYGFRDYRGGGRSSARETACRVAAGAVAKALLSQLHQIKITGYVSKVGHEKLMKPYVELDLEQVESNIVRCPDPEMAENMIQAIQKARDEGDSLGGQVSCVIEGVPAGLGEPVFDKLHADLGKAMLSINAVKGFEIGSGFASIEMRGSEHNDIFENKEGKVTTRTNFSGGVQGGISNGMDIYFNVAFKPVSTIMRNQQTINSKGEQISLEAKGRHDPCVVPRAVPIVEAMGALVIADHLLRNRSAKLNLD